MFKLFRMGVVLYNFLLIFILPACHLSSGPWRWLLSRFSLVCLFVTPWTVASQTPPSMGFSRQEYWSGLPCPPPGDLPDPWSEPVSLTSPALAGRFFTTSTAWEAPWFLLFDNTSHPTTTPLHLIRKILSIAIFVSVFTIYCHLPTPLALLLPIYYSIDCANTVLFLS